jgi:hypothetical protein
MSKPGCRHAASFRNKTIGQSVVSTAITLSRTSPGVWAEESDRMLSQWTSNAYMGTNQADVEVRLALSSAGRKLNHYISMKIPKHWKRHSPGLAQRCPRGRPTTSSRQRCFGTKRASPVLQFRGLPQINHADPLEEASSSGMATLL